MAILVKLDDLLHDRRMTLTELAERVEPAGRYLLQWSRFATKDFQRPLDVRSARRRCATNPCASRCRPGAGPSLP
jgi:hypothetical protein